MTMATKDKVVNITITVGTLVLLIGAAIAWATTGATALIYSKKADASASKNREELTAVKMEHVGYRRDLDDLEEDQRDHQIEQRAMFLEIRTDIKTLADNIPKP